MPDIKKSEISFFEFYAKSPIAPQNCCYSSTSGLTAGADLSKTFLVGNLYQNPQNIDISLF